ncbi:MAG: alanine racemase, partial [Rhodothermales bacterium]
ALRDNVETIRRLAGPQMILAVVKADAYGHGAKVCARAMQPHIDYFAVASVDEGIELRLAGIERPILVFGPPEDRTAPAYVSHQLTATVSDPSHFSILMDGTRYHLNIDTGMRRLGIPPDRLSETRTQALMNTRLTCAGIFSHLATAEDPDSSMVKDQLERFRTALTHFPEVPLRHLCNSGGLFTHRIMEFDMVRIGLPLWGFMPGVSDPIRRVVHPESRAAASSLKPVMRWSSRVVQTRRLQNGDTVSYGAAWSAPDDGWLSTIPVGYADGYRRRPTRPLSVGCVWEGEARRFPVVGTVTMDYIMIDTGSVRLPNGTAVDLLGGTGPDAWELADVYDAIPFDIFTGISSRVPRDYEREGN